MDQAFQSVPAESPYAAPFTPVPESGGAISAPPAAFGHDPEAAGEVMSNYAEMCTPGTSFSMTRAAEAADETLVDRFAPRPMVMDKDSELYQAAHDRGQDAVLDEFLLDYNLFCGPAGLFVQSVGRVEIFSGAAGLDPDVPALAAAEFGELGEKLADPANRGLKNLVDRALVTEDADETVTNALAQLGSAKSGLKAAIGKLRAMEKRLQLRKTEAKKAGLTDQLDRLEAKIARIKEIIAGIEQIAAVAATAYVNAAGAVGSAAKDTIKDRADGGAASAVIGWFVDAGYAPKVDSLKRKIASLDDKISGLHVEIDGAELKAAADTVDQAKSALDAVKVNLKNRLTAQRARYESVGENVDDRDPEASRRRNDEAIPCTVEGKSEQLVRLVGAIRERVTFARALAETMSTGTLANPERVLDSCIRGMSLMPRMDPESMAPAGIMWGDNSLDAMIGAINRVRAHKREIDARLPAWEVAEETWTTLLANAKGGGGLKDF